MSPFLQQTSLAIQDSEQHLTVSKSFGTVIESYLTQHILIVLCAEMQQEIYKIVEQLALANPDKKLSNYVINSQSKILRSVKTSEIVGFLGHFGSSVQDFYKNLVSEEETTIYNNAVTDRHDIAHKLRSSVTFQELRKTVPIAIKILESVNSALTN